MLMETWKLSEAMLMLKDYQGCPRPTLPGVKVETNGIKRWRRRTEPGPTQPLCLLGMYFLTELGSMVRIPLWLAWCYLVTSSTNLAGGFRKQHCLNPPSTHLLSFFARLWLSNCPLH